MGCAVEHGCETEESTCGRLIHDHLLGLGIHSADADTARNQDEGCATRVADFIDSLPNGERSQLDLAGQNSALIIIEQSEKRDIF